MRPPAGLLLLALLMLATPGRADLGEKLWEGPPPVEVVTFTARDTYSPSVSEWPDSVSGTVGLRNLLDVNLEKVRFEVQLVDGGGTRFTVFSRDLPTELILGGGEAALQAGKSWAGSWNWYNIGRVNLARRPARVVVTGLVPQEGHTSGFNDGKVARFRVEASARED